MIILAALEPDKLIKAASSINPSGYDVDTLKPYRPVQQILAISKPIWFLDGLGLICYCFSPYKRVERVWNFMVVMTVFGFGLAIYAAMVAIFVGNPPECPKD